MSYIQLTSPLVLHADPVLPGHAVTKRYVDGKKEFLQASWFTSGVISALRMPALSGDVTSAAGSGIVTLNTTGVTAGTYTKVTVGSSGRVASGGYLTASDIPSVDWGKITSGKPTTAADYGINNLIALSGGTASGHIASSATPTDNLHAVTKAYVDDNVTGVVSASLSVGGVVRKVADYPPSGFLRCNGGYVDKLVYSDLFAVIGYTQVTTVYLDYTQYAAIGSGKPWRMQYDINTTQSTDITGWTTSTPLPGTVHYSQAIVTKNRVYLLGGYISGARSSIVYTAPINQDGTLGAWTTSTSLPATVTYSQAIVTKNRVYLLGGQINGNLSPIVYTAPINPDGTLGGWTTSTTSLPGTVIYSQAIVTKNRVYLLGGRINGNLSPIVYTAPINLDGTLGAWTTSTSLPSTVGNSQAIVTKNRVYLLGGETTSGFSSTVYTASITGGLNDYSKLYDSTVNRFDGSDVTGDVIIEDQNDTGYVQPGSGKPWKLQYDINTTQSTDIGTWTTSTSLPATVAYSQAIVTKNRVYLLGGHTGVAISSTVYTASINLDGTLGAWTTSTSLPSTVSDPQAIVTKNRVYLLGGVTNGSANSSTVYTASINLDGTLGAWTTSTTSLPATVTYSQAIVTKNRVYLLGGITNTGSSSTVYTAPINLDGTLGAWTTSTTSLPGTVIYSQAIVTKNRVYLLGGRINGNLSPIVYTAPINLDGTLGAWTTSTSLPSTVGNSQAIVTKNRVYLLGGETTSGFSSTVYTASITGGLNDYSPYYDGTYTASEANQFRLPDFTAKESNGINFYIKH